MFFQKLDIENNITESHQRLLNQEKKLRALYNLTEVASQSLTDYFDKVEYFLFFILRFIFLLQL